MSLLHAGPRVQSTDPVCKAYATCSTERAYGAMRQAVLSGRMVVPGGSSWHVPSSSESKPASLEE
eukprot:53948-Rhodomonas_salina.4